MNKKKRFEKFLDSMKTEENNLLLESVKNGFKAILESEFVSVNPVDKETFSSQFKSLHNNLYLFDTSDILMDLLDQYDLNYTTGYLSDRIGFDVEQLWDLLIKLRDYNSKEPLSDDDKNYSDILYSDILNDLEIYEE